MPLDPALRTRRCSPPPFGRFASFVACALLVLSAALPAAAQEHGGGEDPLAHRVGEVLDLLEFREIGPTIMSGRISDLAVNEADPSHFVVGTASGGVWQTHNMGLSFEPIFTDQATASVGDVTLAPSNPRVIWVGSGEPQNRQSSPWGNGVYRSVDGGTTWAHLGLDDTHHIARIQVHPADPDVAYVAAMGHLWGPNEERGVYRTRDGGATWEHVLYVDEHTGAIDLVMDPNDPNTLFAAMYQRQRRAWGFNGGGPGSGIWRSYDGGDNWTELTEGLPTGDMGRIGLDIYRGDSNWIYAIVEGDERGGSDTDYNGVYRSWDRGDSWEQTSTTNNRPMYYSQIRVDPSDPERVYLGGSDLFMAQDGGYEFTDEAAAEVHLDHHALWINPANPDHLILGSDGGVSISWDRSEHWYQFRNLPVSQFYEVGVDDRWPYHVCGGLQDNGSWCAPSDTWSNQGIRTRDWYNVGGGDGFFTVMHPDDPDLMFVESQGGNIARVDRGAFERLGIRPQAFDDDGEEIYLRRNWDAPIVLSSHDTDRVYYGAQFLFRTDDLGQSWTRISDDLTYAIDRDTLEIMGVEGGAPQISKNDGQSSYGNLTAIAESPVDAEVLYTGADDGRLMRTTDGGATWTDITGNVPGLPAHAYVTRIVASHGDAGTVVAAFDNHRSDDFAAYLYRSGDFGDSWQRITDGLPESSLNALAQHPRRANLWFTGNEVGVYVSVDSGERWFRMPGLPTVPVDDIEIQERENDLVVGTHGRGIWILDDMGPLAEMDESATHAPVELYPVRHAVSYNTYTPQGWTPGIWVADNPDSGTRIRFHIGHDVADDARRWTLTIRDDQGMAVRSFTGLASAGMHEQRWDLRMQLEDAEGESLGTGPRVRPGTYSVVLEVDGQPPTDPRVAQVILDPRVEIGGAEQDARYAAMMDSYRLGASAMQANRVLAQAARQLADAREMAANRDADATLMDRLAAAEERLDELDDRLGDVDDGAGAWRGIERMHAPPTAQALAEIERSWAEMPAVIGDINAFVSGELRQVVTAAGAVDLEPDELEPVGLPSRGGGV